MIQFLGDLTEGKAAWRYYCCQCTLYHWCVVAIGYDYIPFQLIGTNATDSFDFGSGIPFGYENDEFDVEYLPQVLDGVSRPIFHTGIGIGTTVQTRIYVSSTDCVYVLFWHNCKEYNYVHESHGHTYLIMNSVQCSRVKL